MRAFMLVYFVAVVAASIVRRGQMRRSTARCSALMSVLLVAPILALAAGPNLPTTARKLDGKGIAALYDGSTFKFTDFASDVPLTGTITPDFKNLIESGDAKTYGHFIGSIRIDDDRYCEKIGGGDENCFFVYLNGADIYLVDLKGAVRAVNQKQQ